MEVINTKKAILEDDSDLIYERELKALLEDHLRICHFLMIIAIIVMSLQAFFAIWSLKTLNDLGPFSDSILIQFFHLLKLFHNAYMIYSFGNTLKSK